MVSSQVDIESDIIHFRYKIVLRWN